MSPYLPLTGAAFLLGFLTAIPVGASQAEVAKRALARKPASALLSALGSVTSDTLYGFLALFGLAPFLGRPWVLGAFQALGAAALVFLAFHTWRHTVTVHAARPSPAWAAPLPSFLTGWVLGVTYPPIMFVWLTGATLMRSWGLLPPGDPVGSTLFVLSGALGLFGYLALLTLLLVRTHRFYSPTTLRRIHHGLAVLLTVLAVVFVVQATRNLMGSARGEAAQRNSTKCLKASNRTLQKEAARSPSARGWIARL